MEGIVYSITSRVNGSVYVGSTTHFRQRMMTHVTQIVNGTHPHDEVRRFFRGHKGTDLLIKILKKMTVSGKHDEKLEAEELRWIAKLNSVNRVRKAKTLESMGVEIIDDTGCITHR
jgi:predicted GIY-YIG superfamily endonuclease